MLILKCIGTAILYGIIANFVVLIPMFVIWLVASIIGFGEIGKALAAVIGCLGILGGIIYGFMTPIWAKAERRRKVEAEEAARLQRHEEEQQEYRKQMIVLGKQSTGLFESLPKHLSSAEKYLEQAEVDFADGAFAPFWDSIENAAKMLGRFDEGVRHIKDNSSHYTKLLRKYEDTPPQFPLRVSSVEKLGVGIATAERMQVVVRKAQRDFQFAMIYEQRKTNQILVAGFKNLAQALEQMTWQITASIDDLAGSVNESMRAIHSRLGDLAEMTSQQHDERAARERKALEMLDNIQRGRRPFP
jgi:hypothetical protein